MTGSIAQERFHGPVRTEQGDGMGRHSLNEQNNMEETRKTTGQEPTGGLSKTDMLGGRLVRKGLITEEQLRCALEKQSRTGAYLGETIVEEGFAPAEEVYETIAEMVGVPYVTLSSEVINPDVLQLVPAKLARRFTLMPLYLEADSLYVAVVDHLAIVALDTLASTTGYSIEPLLSTREQIERAIDTYYGSEENLEQDLAEILKTQPAEEEELPSVEQLEVEARDTPVVRFVNLLIRQALQKRASDVHIEPRKDSVAVRVRVDGVLHHLTAPTKAMLPAVITRIKILSGLDIGERRLPQDGRFRLEDHNVDIRVSTMPTIYGEKVVMRLLDKSKLVLELSELGFQQREETIYKHSLQQPQGIVLVTGPTGSGKTTTLYSGLATISRDDRNVITVEDPVEYELEGVNQVHVKPSIGLTFAEGLRCILRQDPDVIMVGEIRDKETATMAVRAALTGHLVLSTVHTNSAVATINRLRNIGVESFLLGSCLTLLLAQRLVRKICPECKAPHTVPDDVREKLGLRDGQTYYHGEGCPKCNQTGYYGRLALFEMLPIDRELAALISEDADKDQLLATAHRKGFRTLREDGVARIEEGVTTAEEVIARTME